MQLTHSLIVLKGVFFKPSIPPPPPPHMHIHFHGGGEGAGFYLALVLSTPSVTSKSRRRLGGRARWEKISGEQWGKIGPSPRQRGGESDLSLEGREGPNSKLLTPGLVIIVTDNSEIWVDMDGEIILSSFISETDHSYVHLKRFLTWLESWELDNQLVGAGLRISVKLHFRGGVPRRHPESGGALKEGAGQGSHEAASSRMCEPKRCTLNVLIGGDTRLRLETH